MGNIPLYRHVGNSRWGYDVLTGKDVLVDDEDVAILSPHLCRLTSAGYAYTRIDGKQVLMHRYLTGLQHGDIRQVDHVNHDRLDNQKSNLVVMSQLQNIRNVGEYPRKYSKYPGVSASRNKWRAYVGKKYLGVFHCEEDAARVAEAARIERGW